MRGLHLQKRLLNILEDYRLDFGLAMTREDWVLAALQDFWVKCHYPILSRFQKLRFRRRIEKAINPLIPPKESFPTMSRSEKLNFFTTYNSPFDSNGYPTEEKLEVTDKGIDFIELGGYIQELFRKRDKVMTALLAFLGSSIFVLFLKELIEFIKNNFR